MSLLSIALKQIQMTPVYHESYVKIEQANKKRSSRWNQRKELLYTIVCKVGKSQMCKIFTILRESDKTLHEDSARKMLNELVDDRRLVKTEVFNGRKNVFYEAVAK